MDQEIYGLVKAILDEWNTSDKISFQSSGSTGEAKKMSFSKNLVIASINRSNQFFGLDKMDSFLCPLHPKYVAGKMMILRALHLKKELRICDPSNLALAIGTTNYDFAPLVPLQLEKLLDLKSPLPKCILLGGSLLDPSLADRIAKLAPNATIFQGYGMTETLTHIAIREVFPHLQEAYELLPGVEVRTGLQGNLEIKLDAQSEWISTTDQVEIDDNKLFYKGRLDDIINTGGYKCNPLEIESLLKPLISEAFFIAGIPDKKLGQKVVLVVEGNHVDYQLEDIKKTLLSQCSPYAIPKEIMLVSNFKRTLSGKIKRRESLRH